MRGETNLQLLLAGMDACLHDPVFAFASVYDVPAEVTPIMVFREAEGMTIVAEASALEAVGIEFTYRCRMITLQIHSALDAVGFLAVITTRLAADGISVNPVSAFHHDHLFVPEERADEAIALLRKEWT